MSTNPDRHLGYITIRIPIMAVTESESWEIPEEYTYLASGDAELVSHDIPAGWHETLRDDLIENGLTFAEWTAEELAAKSTLAEEPVPAEPANGLFSFPKGLPL